jgi:RNase H-like domain found in reverse transcriptase
LLPNINDFADSFVGHSVYIVVDLYAGYDGCCLAEESQELTTSDSPLGPVMLTTLPQGYRNSMQEFMKTVTHMIRPMILEKAKAFVDDIAGKGPKTWYNDKPITEHPKIQCYIWEFAQIVDELFATFIEARCTASGTKLVLATPLIHIVGNVCSMEGRRPHHGIITKVQNWPCPKNVTQVCRFLGTVGVAQNWIWQFAKIAKPLTLLTKKSPHEFEWNDQAEEAMNQLKEASMNLPAQKSLNIDIVNILKEDKQTSDYGLVTLAVDSSIIAVGWIEYQTLEDGHHPIVFGSVTNNEAESRYSQPQIELKGLFKALKAQRNDLGESISKWK